MALPTLEERRNARVILNRLKKRYPKISTALDYVDPWNLLVATVLSAQTTDANVNRVTPVLFERWPTPEDLAAANPEEVEQAIFSTGYYRQKTKSIISLAADLVDRHDGVVPADLDELVKLRGVGRKTASVVLAEAFDIPAIAVDTHVKRVSNRLGLVSASDPVKIESALKALYPESDWEAVSMRFIQFGATCATRRNPPASDVRSPTAACTPTRPGNDRGHVWTANVALMLVRATTPWWWYAKRSAPNGPGPSPSSPAA